MTVAITDQQTFQHTLRDSDIRVEWCSGTGSGGQHRNKHQNSVRLTHLPTGIVCTSQCRSRENSMTEARRTLETRVLEQYSSKHSAETAISRRLQVGSGERGDKIRTYRFQDGTVKDHRTGRSSSVDRIMAGDFSALHD